VKETQLNEEERSALATLVMSIFADWELDAEYQKLLLGLEDVDAASQLSKYRYGTAFPQDPALIERARHVVGIQQSLHRVFPLNDKMPAFWLYNRNRQLNGMPMEIMVEEGLPGMTRVWRWLDCTITWD
jgi:hypothetical protein